MRSVAARRPDGAAAPEWDGDRPRLRWAARWLREAGREHAPSVGTAFRATPEGTGSSLDVGNRPDGGCNWRPHTFSENMRGGEAYPVHPEVVHASEEFDRANQDGARAIAGRARAAG